MTAIIWILVSFVPSYEMPVIRNREVSLPSFLSLFVSCCLRTDWTLSILKRCQGYLPVVLKMRGISLRNR